MNYNSSINYDHDSLITVYNGVLINASVNVLSTLVYTSFCFNRRERARRNILYTLEHSSNILMSNAVGE
jgi:hypothetical protein